MKSLSKQARMAASVVLGSALVAGTLITTQASPSKVARTVPGEARTLGPSSNDTWTQIDWWTAPPAWQGNPDANGGVGEGAWVACFEGLFQYARPTGKIYNRMAESVDNSNPAQTVVHLRHNIKWNDGKPFTSKDVWAYYTLNWGAELTKYLTKIETPDPYTVIFKWANPKLDTSFKMWYLSEDYQWIPYHLAKKWVDEDAALFAKLKPTTNRSIQTAFQLQQTPEFQKETGKVWTDFINHYHPKFPIGTGPYVVKKVTSSDMYLDVNPYYYNKKAITFKHLHFIDIADQNQQLALLRAGKISWMDATPPKDVLTSILAANKNLVHYTWPDTPSVGVIFNQRHQPFQNVKFRQAIAYLLDRKKIREVSNYYAIDTPYAGLGMLPSQANEYLPKAALKKLTKYTFNQQKAAKLLESIGWKKGADGIWRDQNGKSYNFIVAGPSNWEPYITPAGELFAEQMTAFGLPTQFKSVDQSLYWTNAQNGTYDMTINFTDWDNMMTPWSSMMTLYETWIAYKEAGLPLNNGVGTLVDTGYDGQNINVAQLLAKIPYQTKEQQKHSYGEIAYVTNENAWYVNFYQNAAGEWLNMADVKNLPWANAFKKYNRNMPFPPANLLQDIANLSQWFSGGEHFVQGN
ncbi:MAG: hypothetical protein K6T83_00415 [Alicyclobacillus sp.]|nr:hypothetical protein [Alicyclobacillus sp.]